jgi:DNA-binding SARP family transcriptional activator
MLGHDDRVSSVATLRLFGGFRLAVGGAEVPIRAVPQRVVAVLALRGRMSRSRLAGTLWPEADEQRALARLRTAIWRVNQGAPNVVEAGAGQVTLHADVDVDVRRLVGAARTVERDEAPDLGHWLVEGPGGELLPDWDDDWLVEERERLHQMRLHTLQAVAERLADTGRYGLAIDVALAVLSSDPVRETAYRTLMRIHRAEGNLGEVHRTYRQCAEVLDRELGLAPQRETDALLAAAPPGPAPGADPPPLGHFALTRR